MTTPRNINNFRIFLPRFVLHRFHFLLIKSFLLSLSTCFFRFNEHKRWINICGGKLEGIGLVFGRR